MFKTLTYPYSVNITDDGKTHTLHVVVLGTRVVPLGKVVRTDSTHWGFVPAYRMELSDSDLWTVLTYITDLQVNDKNIKRSQEQRR